MRVLSPHETPKPLFLPELRVRIDLQYHPITVIIDISCGPKVLLLYFELRPLFY